MLETGRVPFLLSRERPILTAGTAFVIARLAIDFKSELNWPGTAEVGTRVRRIGTSSMTLEQAIYQNGVCAAMAETVIVAMDETTRRSCPLSPVAVARLTEVMAGDAG